MASFNKVIIIGNMTQDPELKQTQSGTSVCSFNVAVNRFSKEPVAKKVDFFTVVAWQTKAEFVTRYFKKGQSIIVCGRLENRDWSDKQGNERVSTEIVAEEVTFCGGAEKSETTTSMPKGNAPYMPSAYQNAPQLEEVPVSDDLPF